MGEIQVIEGNGTSARNNKIGDHCCYGARQQECEKNTSQNQHHGEGAMAINGLSTCAHRKAMVTNDRSIAPHAEALRRLQPLQFRRPVQVPDGMIAAPNARLNESLCNPGITTLHVSFRSIGNCAEVESSRPRWLTVHERAISLNHCHSLLK